MAGIDALLGASGVIEQLLLWNVVSQVVSSLMTPAFNALTQDVLKEHPNVVITPDILARAVAQTFMTKADAQAEALKSGLDASRFNILLDLADIRLAPAELAEAVLRSYLTRGEGEQQAKIQGIDAARFTTLTLLAGDGMAPEQAAEALRRGILPHHGMGPDAVTYDQAIAESRLHNKWGEVLFDLTRALLSPPDAAEAVVRGFLAHADGAAVAELSGMDAATFGTIVSLAADAPSPTDLAIALRRGVIPENSGDASKPGFTQGIQQGRLGDKWIPMLRALAQEWPTPTDALQAKLTGQVTTEQSKEMYAKFGGDPQFWQFLFDVRGSSPTPLELIEMANRGFIPWSGTGPDATTYEQGFNEGPWRDKWRPIYKKFAEYIPPESTVTTLLAHGQITDKQAAKLLAQQGMDADLITAYIGEAHTEALSDYRGATVSMVLTAYYQQLLTAKQATPILESLHVTPVAVKFMLDYEDTQRAFTAVNNALSRTRSLYAARKITLATARHSLESLGVQPDAIGGILKSWQIENSISVKVLTEAQIADAWAATLITDTEALTELGNIGYTPFDAWLLLSIKAKAPIEGKPDIGPPHMQDAVTPGTT